MVRHWVNVEESFREEPAIVHDLQPETYDFLVYALGDSRQVHTHGLAMHDSTTILAAFGSCLNNARKFASCGSTGLYVRHTKVD